MEIEYMAQLKKPDDAVDLYKALKWYQLSGYTDEDIKKANESFYSIYAYDGDTLVGLGRVASDGLIAAVMSGICVRGDYRRRGIGAEIVRRIVEYCQTGMYKLNVQLFCEDSLIPWYEDMGFEKMPVGMRKSMPMDERCILKRRFGDIYGIEQITDIAEDFYWFNFDAFGDFSYYGGMGSEGVKVPFIRMTLFSNEPVKFSAEIIFENVSEFEIGCMGVRTPLLGFDIMSTEKLGYSDKKRYMIRSLEDDDIRFFCETFRVMSVKAAANSICIAAPKRVHEGISQLIVGADDAEAEYDAAHSHDNIPVKPKPTAEPEELTEPTEPDEPAEWSADTEYTSAFDETDEDEDEYESSDESEAEYEYVPEVPAEEEYGEAAEELDISYVRDHVTLSEINENSDRDAEDEGGNNNRHHRGYY